MPHRFRKIRKKRGTRTVGWGRVGQHRKSGQRGGRKVGRRKHLRSHVLRYEPDYFVVKGFVSPRRKKVNSVNVGDLEELAVKLSAERGLEKVEGLLQIDLDNLGYDKLLGMGNLARPFSLKVASYSRSAAKKVEEAGGKIVTKTKSAGDVA